MAPKVIVSKTEIIIIKKTDKGLIVKDISDFAKNPGLIIYERKNPAINDETPIIPMTVIARNFPKIMSNLLAQVEISGSSVPRSFSPAPRSAAIAIVLVAEYERISNGIIKDNIN